MGSSFDQGRRQLLGVAAIAAGWLPAAAAQGAEAGRPMAVAAAWRCALKLSPQGEVLGPGPERDHVGILLPDWDDGRLLIRAAVPVPDRVHGLLADGSGGFFAVAYRPGPWLLHVGAQGQVLARHALADEGNRRTFNGHVTWTPDRRHLVTSETDADDSAGWVSLRDPQTLRRVDEWPSGGVEPHDIRFDPAGRLWIANGGILRAAMDRKRDLDRMQPTLVALDVASGRPLGRWELDDPRLSLRHLAVGLGSEPLIGVALQAEHDDPGRRGEAPLLAVCDGQRFFIPSRQAIGKGYSSDIAPGPVGGFFLASERSHHVLRWDPRRPETLQTVGELERAGALAPWRTEDDGRTSPDGVYIAAARGLARWHPSQPAKMLRWPIPMAIDNHLVPLG